MNIVKMIFGSHESLMEEVELLAQQSTLPEKADSKYWERFIVDCVQEHVR